MLAKMRPSELGLWAALWRIEPWGDERADLRSAIVASVLANVNRNPQKRSQPFQPKDFMPYVQQEKSAQDEDLSRRLRATLGAGSKAKKGKR
jgi:hypothetical protein